MATAVLHAQDCLDLHRKEMGAVYYGAPKSKSQSHHNRRKATGPKPCNPKGVPEFQDKKRPMKSGEFPGESGKRYLKNQNQNHNHQRREPKNFVTGHVTILKRESLESKGHMMGRLGVSPPKSGAGELYTGSGLARSELYTGSGLARSVSADFKLAEKWAGPAFANSPSPRCLPLPNFPVKKAAQVDDLATRDLRRLLGLD